MENSASASSHPESPLSPPEEQKTSFNITTIKHSQGDIDDEETNNENTVPEDPIPPKQEVVLKILNIIL